MRDLFICPQNIMRANWLDAFPGAKLYKAVSSVKLSKKFDYIFWLHMNAGEQAWVDNSILEILNSFPNSKIVVLSNVPDQAEAMVMLALGAVGYCHTYSPPELLKDVKEAILHGGIWIGRDLLKKMIETTKTLVGNNSSLVKSNLDKLTSRERQVAIQASKGLSNKEIARDLNITERTVKAHLSSIFNSLSVKDRLQLALMLNEKNST